MLVVDVVCRLEQVDRFVVGLGLAVLVVVVAGEKVQVMPALQYQEN